MRGAALTQYQRNTLAYAVTIKLIFLSTKMILLIANTKGGVGKTTLALQMATARALQGRRVLAIDGDRQGSLIASLTARAESGKPAIAAAHLPDGPTLRAQLAAQAGLYDDVVIDAGGRDSTALRAGLMAAHLVLIPVQPRALDMWALADLASLIDEARSMRDGLRTVAVLNQADPQARARDNDDARTMMADTPQIDRLGPAIVRRKALANAAGLGLHVSELKPEDERASAEIAELATFIFQEHRA